MRFRYWSCSKIADYIRGEKKPPYLPLGQWNVWRDRMKKERPLRYYLSDTLLKTIQDVVYYPYDVYHNVKMYFLHRNLYLLDTGLPKGKYYDLDTRILYACFNEFSKLFEYNDKHYVFSESDQDLKLLYDWWQQRKNAEVDSLSPTIYEEDTEKLKQLINCRERLWI